MSSTNDSRHRSILSNGRASHPVGMDLAILRYLVEVKDLSLGESKETHRRQMDS